MDQPSPHDLAATVGSELAPIELITEIVRKVGNPDPDASDDDLYLWWGSVEIDRLASGLTLATINKLSQPSREDLSTGPWLQKSDDTGDAPTQLTPEGKAVVRQIGVVQPEE